MIIRKAYKFRMKPDQEQLLKLKSFAGHCRFVWNPDTIVIGNNEYRSARNRKTIYMRHHVVIKKSKGKSR